MDGFVIFNSFMYWFDVLILRKNSPAILDLGNQMQHPHRADLESSECYQALHMHRRDISVCLVHIYNLKGLFRSFFFSRLPSCLSGTFQSRLQKHKKEKNMLSWSAVFPSGSQQPSRSSTESQHVKREKGDSCKQTHRHVCLLVF